MLLVVQARRLRSHRNVAFRRRSICLHFLGLPDLLDVLFIEHIVHQNRFRLQHIPSGLCGSFRPRILPGNELARISRADAYMDHTI